jgi:hypothetical protein
MLLRNVGIRLQHYTVANPEDQNLNLLQMFENKVLKETFVH